MLAIRKPGTGRRQAEPNPRLAAENARLRTELRDLAHRHAGAGHLIESLNGQLRDTDAHIEGREAELRQTASELGTAVAEGMEFEARAAEAERLRDAEHEELIALRQFKANVTAVTAPPMERDTTGEDTLVTPIPVPEYGDPMAVRALWDAPFAAAASEPAEGPPPMKLQFAAGASKVTVSGGPRPATA
jgi:predicted RNase H-like nuclease (RuvC/YqgF family)